VAAGNQREEGGTPLEETEKVLLENLKETAKSAQTYLMTGNGTALFLLLLATQGQLAEGTTETNVEIPVVGLSAPTFTAALIALAVYILSGIMALSLAWRFRQIKEKLQGNQNLLDAALTYPSLFTASKGVQFGAVLLPAIIGATALFAAYAPAHGASKAIWTAICLSSPYLWLAGSMLKEVLKQK
jgi:hypothetical protein